jgi:hypothetical protein
MWIALAQNVICASQNALGHCQIITTIQYLSVKDKKVDKIIHQLV